MSAPQLGLIGLEAGAPLVGPSSIHIDVTNSCNTNCVTCWDHSPHLDEPRSAAWKRQRVDLARVEELLDDAGSLGALRAVVISGMGDPFVHPEIYELLEAVKSRGLHLTVITNLIPADPERILALSVDQLLIGIHAASEEAYRAFHPSFQSDEWTRLHAALTRFSEAGCNYKHVQVICGHNAHELVEMVELGARYEAARVIFKLAGLKAGTEAVRISAAQRRELVEVLVPAAQACAERLGVTTNLDVFERQLAAGGEATAPISEIGCFMGYVYSRILVDGTVLYCCNTDVVIGSLQDARFHELWRGEAWEGWRARLRGGDYPESCNQCGKINENLKLSRRFERRFGRQRLLEVTGRAASARALPLAGA
ncbi:MAG: radical SAM protein [Planctomycetes bacterium]|nr:radical SAM protein [Planctomycetota bacterium]